ncbi:hypothetical protein V3C99_001534, partial [Haemonchus contortus]
CMGHRGFVQPNCQSKSGQASKSSSHFRTSNTSAQKNCAKMAPVNGIRELSEEQLAEAQEIRAKFRDDVSKKMGELLLRGVTMLDAYCHICDGILMEDRNGVRRCVTCELLEEHTKEGSRLVAEVPLDATADGFTPGNSALSNELPVEQNAACFSKNLPVKQDAEPTHCSDGCNVALLAIDRKLRWLGGRIDQTENLSEIRELFALVHEGLNIIRHAKTVRE